MRSEKDYLKLTGHLEEIFQTQLFDIEIGRDFFGNVKPILKLKNTIIYYENWAGKGRWRRNGHVLKFERILSSVSTDIAEQLVYHMDLFL